LPAGPGGDVAPLLCLTCGGTKEERKLFSVAELKDLIAL
jgi:hypothetical protein